MKWRPFPFMTSGTDLALNWIGCFGMALFLLSCGGGAQSTPPAPPISVAVSTGSPIVQAGRTVQFQASVTNSSNQEVIWAVAQPGGIGSITTTGLYSAPTYVDATVDVNITATSSADPTKSASAKITVFAAPAIAIRQNNGRGEFYTVRDSARFVPRGNNYLHFDPSMTRLLDGQVGYGRSTLNSELYNPAQAERAFVAMEAQGYNVVRTFLDILQKGDIGNDSGPGLSSKYVANLADFMKRAKAHHIYVLPIFEELPLAGGYRDVLPTDLTDDFFRQHNRQLLTDAGVAATRRFWRDLIQALVQAHAPMDALLAYELVGEFYIYNAAWPLDQNSGTIQTANGLTYNLADPAARFALQNDNMVFYADEMRGAVRSINPDALVIMGFFSYNGTNPPPFPAISNATVDFIDLHGWPDSSGTPIDQLLAAWQVNGDLRKPIIMGEYDAFTDVFPTTSQAAEGLKAWQISGCLLGFSGWMLWTWDTEPNELPGLNTWSAMSGQGEIDQALAPINRPNACIN